MGYQGLSSRSSIHRHSPTVERANQTGTPRPPARWATEVSGVITRSSRLIDGGGVEEVARTCAARSRRSGTARQGGDLVQAVVRLDADQLDARNVARGRELASGKERKRSIGWFGLPCQATPTSRGLSA